MNLQQANSLDFRVLDSLHHITEHNLRRQGDFVDVTHLNDCGILYISAAAGGCLVAAARAFMGSQLSLERFVFPPVASASTTAGHRCE